MGDQPKVGFPLSHDASSSLVTQQHGYYRTDASMMIGGSNFNGDASTSQNFAMANVNNSGAFVQSLWSYTGNNNRDYQQQAYFDSFPPGYRFKPSDDELIVYYLQRRIRKQQLPPNNIHEVELYNYSPETLAANYRPNGEEWYFLTPRYRKYLNGNRPDRAAGNGYWKATGADKSIIFQNVQVGLKKALVFYRGKAIEGGVKTDWIMHEYRVNDDDHRPKKNETETMRLDECVLCRIYKKGDRSVHVSTRQWSNAIQVQSENGILSQHHTEVKEALLPNVTRNCSNTSQMANPNTFDGFAYHQSSQNGLPINPECLETPSEQPSSCVAKSEDGYADWLDKLFNDEPHQSGQYPNNNPLLGPEDKDFTIGSP